MEAIFQTFGGRVFTKLHYEPEHRRIHVLDQNVPGSKSVTNGIDSIQSEILKKLRLEGKPEDYQWILYGTDGIPVIFDRGNEHRYSNFEFCPEEMLYPPFQEESKRLSGK